MKTGRFFWGTFFVVIGVLVLLSNLDYVQIDWSLSWKFWPLILIFWGASKFTEIRGIKALFATLNGVLLACMVFGFFSFQWFTGPYDDNEPLRYTQTLSEPFDSTLDHATFHFSGGAGRFMMEKTTDNLVEARTESAFGQYELDQSQEDGSADVSLRMMDRRSYRFFGRMGNRANIQLNSEPAWEMRFNVGASKLDLDLSPYKAEQVTIDAGVSTIRVRLGDRANETNVRIKTGLSSVRIEVPSSVGCEVYDNAHIGRTEFDDFSRAGTARWQTDNFESAGKKIFIEVDAGVSSIRVKRY